jgi:hypothetical protein
MSVEPLRYLSRATGGVKLVTLDAGTTVVAVAHNGEAADDSAAEAEDDAGAAGVADGQPPAVVAGPEDEAVVGVDSPLDATRPTDVLGVVQAGDAGTTADAVRGADDSTDGDPGPEDRDDGGDDEGDALPGGERR